MSRRVYELARDMGISGTGLASKINSMGLGFSVNNHMSTLSEDQETELRRALDREVRKNMVAERITSTVIRRKPRRRKVVAAVVTPVVEAPPVVVRDAVSASEALPVPVAVAPDPEPAPQQAVVEAPVAAVETPIVEAEPERVVEAPPAEPEPTPVPERTPEPAPVVVAPEPVVILSPTEQRRRRVGLDRASIMAAMAAKQQQTTGTSRPVGKRAAQVVGALSPELLQQRLAVDNKVFGPPVKQQRPPTGTRETFEADQAGRRKRKRGKKVYGASELYDRRSNRRRAQKKTGGQATQITQAAEHKRVIKMEEAILVADLAHQMGVKAGEIAMKLMLDLGMRGANINTPIDFDGATLIADIYGYTVDQVGFDLRTYLPKFEDKPDDYVSRPPVVTVMGHVDHGKTSLLDAIRQSNVVGGEHGGITQHIGAYRVHLPNKRGVVAFLDTPGHEAFTALRARGAQATDIVILVVAADDGVMPQTVEAINHARDAGVPIVVAINKIDKAGANPDRVMQALSEYDLIPEAWGGTTLYQQVSAIEGTGVDDLLESLVLQAELLELKTNPKHPAFGKIIESRLDIGRGPVATVLVQQGLLKPGQTVVVGGSWGRIRALASDQGKKLKKAGASVPVEITGLDGVPDAGDTLYVVEDEKAARAIADHISQQRRQKVLAKMASTPSSLDDLTAMLERGQLKDLKLIVKSDVQGSQEALCQALEKLSNDEVVVKIVHAAVGGITENDINLAASSQGGALIIGFNVRPESRAMHLAEQMNITVLTFNVIYDAVDRIKQVVTGMLAPILEENYLGRAEVRNVFGIPKIGKVAGCYVIDGRILRSAKARVLRDSVVIYDNTNIGSLRRFKDDVREVKSGFECGITVDNFNDIKLGDVIEAYEVIEVRPPAS